jgi:hypothetical protein
LTGYRDGREAAERHGPPWPGGGFQTIGTCLAGRICVSMTADGSRMPHLLPTDVSAMGDEEFRKLAEAVADEAARRKG